MKLTKTQLKQIIKEELENISNEDETNLLTEAMDILPLLTSISREATDPGRGRGDAMMLASEFFDKLSEFLSDDAYKMADALSKKLYTAAQKA